MNTEHRISGWSPIAAVKELAFYGIPKRKAIDVMKIAKHCDIEVYESKDGKMYSSSVRYSGSHTFGRGKMDYFYRCALKLGKITRSQLRDHLQQATAYENAVARRRAIDRFTRDAQSLGIVLNKKQLSALNKYVEVAP